MIPLLQKFIHYDYKILPITITFQTFDNAKYVAEQIKKANDRLKKRIFIIASTDFSHFIHPKKGEELDQLVIDKILHNESREVESVIKKNHISVCGPGPIMALMEYAKLVADNPNINLLKKGNSGDIIPSNEVVDYVSMMFYK